MFVTEDDIRDVSRPTFGSHGMVVPSLVTTGVQSNLSGNKVLLSKQDIASNNTLGNGGLSTLRKQGIRIPRNIIDAKSNTFKNERADSSSRESTLGKYCR
jgi:hypothetical protein